MSLNTVKTSNGFIQKGIKFLNFEAALTSYKPKINFISANMKNEPILVISFGGTYQPGFKYEQTYSHYFTLVAKFGGVTFVLYNVFALLAH